jgi:hypothetical protein
VKASGDATVSIFVEVKATTVEALALAGEGFIWLVAALHALLFPASSGYVFLLEPEALVFLVKTC